MNLFGITLVVSHCLFILNADNPLLLFATRKNIRLLDTGDARNNATIVIDLEDAAAMDYLFAEQRIFWTDVGKEVIQSTAINESQIRLDSSVYHPSRVPTTVISTGLISPDGLACDWITRKIYWTDSETKRMEVSNLDGSMRSVLIWTGLDQPRAIALDPLKGYMYWTDWGEEPKIERAGMNAEPGSRQVLIKDKIFWPNGLTLDYELGRFFWVDAKLHHIHSAAFDGTDRQVILSGVDALVHPFALTVSKGSLFWTDWETKAIHACNKANGTDRKKVYSKIDSPMDIHVFDKSRQPSGGNPCSPNNGGCSHLCLLAPSAKRYTCACPTGVRLLEDGKTCADGPQHLLLLARRTDLRCISLDTPDHTDIIIPAPDCRHGVAIDYDPIEAMVYWTDDEVQNIRRIHLNGSEVEVIVSTEVVHPDGLAVDWIARNVYWTDTGTNRIEVARLNGSSRRIVVTEGLDEPRALTLDPVRGFMYWTDWGGVAKIERAALDGSDRLVLVNTSLVWPNGLALDYGGQMLYWSDAQLDRIEMCKTDGSNRQILLNTDLPHIFGLSVLDDYIYWTDWQRRSIERISKHPGQNSQRQFIIEHLPDLMGLKAVNIKSNLGTNPCAGNNYGCSHLCLMRPAGPICACPIDQELLPNGKACIVPDAFLVYSNSSGNDGSDIRRISLETNNSDVVIPLNNVRLANDLDFDQPEDRIYWSDSKAKTISRAFMNGSAMEIVIEWGLENPECIAVDWIARNLYWGDPVSNMIEMARLNGSSRKVLLQRKNMQPYSLALDPAAGYLYWAEWRSGFYGIMKADLDCTEDHQFYQMNYRPKSLTIDVKGGQLYWIVLELEQIEAIDLNGANHRVVIPGVNEPRAYLGTTPRVSGPQSLTQLDGHIFWADATSSAIKRANKTTGGDVAVLKENPTIIHDLLVFQRSRELGWNPCSVHNGNCSHLCIHLPAPSNGSRKCSCPTHYSLLADNQTCKEPVDFLLVAQKTSTSRLVWEGDSPYPVLTFPIRDIKKVIKRVSYDPVNKFIYWIEGRVIKRANEQGKEVETIVEDEERNNISPFDMALDPFGQTLYWSDQKNNVINVTKLGVDQASLGAVVSLPNQYPRDIALDPINGLLFWINGDEPPHIECAEMDGTSHQLLFDTNLGRPHSLLLDPPNRKLYWADNVLKRIERADYHGQNRETFIDLKMYVNGETVMALLGSYVYWHNGDSVLQRQSTKHATDESSEESSLRLAGLVDLVGVELLSDSQLRSHPCSYNNGHCSHLCVPKTLGEGITPPGSLSLPERRRCSCPLGLLLNNDEQTCGQNVLCKKDEFTCANKQECFPLIFVCDGEFDCTDTSDELNCLTCEAGQFRCMGGRCMDFSQRCDGNNDCALGDDEKDCPPCAEGMFECTASKTCLQYELKCNGDVDCLPGGEDEEICKEGAPVYSKPVQGTGKSVIVIICVAILVLLIVVALFIYCNRKTNQSFTDSIETQDRKPLKPQYAPERTDGFSYIDMNSCPRTKLVIAGATHSSISGSSPYDRNHVTGASSSSSAETPYPDETLNPPPSPVTSDQSPPHYDFMCSSPSTIVRSYQRPRQRPPRSHTRHKRHCIAPPPTTPCSTDVCEESEPCSPSKHYQFSDTTSAYSDRFYPPPPTPRSHYQQPSCPPSPSTEHSYFNPYPPPPSPVTFCDG